MNSAMKFGLIAIAAWWLLKDQLPGFTATAPAPAEPVTPQTSNASPAPAPAGTTPPPTSSATPPAPPAQLGDPLVLAATVPAMAHLAGNTRLTADQWNWYNAQGRGTQTSVDLFTPANRTELITAEEYWVRRLAAGLSGIRRLERAWVN